MDRYTKIFIEAVDGRAIATLTIGPCLNPTVDRYTKIFIEAVDGRVTFDDRTMPEPDLALLKWRDDFYESRPAGPDDILLIIEVSDSSLEYDRGEKLALYARFGIPEVWISALPEHIVEVHTEPVDGRYKCKRIYVLRDAITPRCFPDISLPVGQIMPS